MSIAVTPSVVQDIVDNADERELWIVGREHEREPYFFPGKGGDTRLARALRVCIENRIMPNGDGSYMVEGSEHRTYRVGESCSCPNSQKAHTKWCYHMVAVAVYVEWQRRLRPVAPVVLGTMRTGTAPMPRVPTPDDDELGNGFPVDDETLPLPLPPVTVDERLAAAAHDAQARALALSTMPDSTALSTNHTPQEDMMADEYIPEPDNNLQGTTAVLEPPRAIPETRPLPGPVLLPSLDARTLEQSMQAWSAQRQVVKRFLQTQLIEGTDYYSLKIGQRETKPTLSKAGSEKFLGLFQLHASFAQDDATWTMLGKPEGTLCYVCHLMTRSGEIVGEGRGARRVSQDNGDINKAVKMAQKSATIDAVLRTGALSEAFTQDLEPDDQPTPVKPTGQEQRQRIWHMVQAQAPEMKTREQVETWIKAETSYTLHPDNYANIIVALEARA